MTRYNLTHKYDIVSHGLIILDLKYSKNFLNDNNRCLGDEFLIFRIWPLKKFQTKINQKWYFTRFKVLSGVESFNLKPSWDLYEDRKDYMTSHSNNRPETLHNNGRWIRYESILSISRSNWILHDRIKLSSRILNSSTNLYWLIFSQGHIESLLHGFESYQYFVFVFRWWNREWMIWWLHFDTEYSRNCSKSGSLWSIKASSKNLSPNDNLSRSSTQKLGFEAILKHVIDLVNSIIHDWESSTHEIKVHRFFGIVWTHFRKISFDLVQIKNRISLTHWIFSLKCILINSFQNFLWRLMKDWN